ncbi:hypothetical protein N8I77_007684 [Diaporthe amygdali]|uniref:Mitochondrial carrier protein n=1 Tax=Phomopsis amygdali TaxID=1214568 RepID=A0AAD9SBQ2_PHOAM|nr:hypothetical protein N8I77_007684 [Diaporthe amygdali]
MNPTDPGRRAGDPSSPFDFGVLPVVAPDSDRNPRTNAATAATAAGVRAFTAQAIAFYFRAPVKAFFRTRVDYLAYARNLQQQQQPHSYLLASLSNAQDAGKQTWGQWLRSVGSRTTPGILASAVKHHGWRIIPDQVLPPLIANVGVGAVLYTSYLQILGRLHEESSRATKRVYPPPSPGDTFTAGLLAGSIQSVAAAPLDAIQARFERGGKGPEMISDSNGRPQSMWSFSYAKLREIGLRGIFAGWGLSFAKDSLGSGVFFCTFEYIKAQSYYSFVAWYYGQLSEDVVNVLSRRRPTDGKDNQRLKTIQPHYAIEPAFLMLAGMGASIAQQVIIHPLTHVQMEHWEHLEYLDSQSRKYRKYQNSKAPGEKWRWKMFRAYYHAYKETWSKCVEESKSQEGNGPNALRRWLFRGFWWNALRQVPSTSAGLVIFELVRRKYGMGGDAVRINRDGYDILLT